ncbi:hypothetical protein [Puniceibacterium sp. IMCC21224]|uniref:hypothetical protein n=1 Tax=Puniceibacterium sp. IMCC21224 TaxID=1618204 RepID=UPI00064D9D7E|nr:hypothetical protein [Puniceibacterium sp. IMCC21224]
MLTRTSPFVFTTGARSPGLVVLYCAACPMLFWLFHGTAANVLATVLLLALFAAALWLLAQGQRICEAYDTAEIARRPRLPRKIIGSGLIGLLVTFLASAQMDGILSAMGVGLLATMLAVAAFGLDPMSDKGTDDPEILLRHRAAEMTDAADRSLARLVSDVTKLDDEDLIRSTDAARRSMMTLVRALAGNPAALRGLRKPLVKVLELALDEGALLVDAWDGPHRDQARIRYVTRLGALTRAFELRARQRALVRHDAFGLETDLLIERMNRETAA